MSPHPRSARPLRIIEQRSSRRVTPALRDRRLRVERAPVARDAAHHHRVHEQVPEGRVIAAIWAVPKRPFRFARTASWPRFCGWLESHFRLHAERGLLPATIASREKRVLAGERRSIHDT